MNKTYKILLAWLIALLIFLILPVDYEELYKCPSDSKYSCIALYSTSKRGPLYSYIIKSVKKRTAPSNAPGYIAKSETLNLFLGYWSTTNKEIFVYSLIFLAPLLYTLALLKRKS